MKNKLLFLAALLFFISVNTKYFWEGKLGNKAFPVFMLQFLIYGLLAGGLFRQLYLLLKEKGGKKSRLLLILFLFFVLASSFLRPAGLINFDALEGKDVLIASRTGVANCNTNFKLKDNFTFKEKTYCFGIEEFKGKYRLKNDSIFFIDLDPASINYFSFAVIKKTAAPNEPATLLFYRKGNDTVQQTLFVKKNLLPK